MVFIYSSDFSQRKTIGSTSFLNSFAENKRMNCLSDESCFGEKTVFDEITLFANHCLILFETIIINLFSLVIYAIFEAL